MSSPADACKRTQLGVAEAHELHLQLALLAAQPPHHDAAAGRYLRTQSHPPVALQRFTNAWLTQMAAYMSHCCDS